jgi:hypothetical protein
VLLQSLASNLLPKELSLLLCILESFCPTVPSFSLCLHTSSSEY